MTSVRRFGKQTVFYAVGTFVQRAASLLLLPLYTTVLSVSEYGAVETLTVLYQTLAILVNFGLSNALLRFYAECNDEEDVQRMVRTSSLLVLGLSIAILLILLPFTGPIASALFQDAGFNNYVLLTLLWAIGGAFNQQLFAYYRARLDARTYVMISLGLFVLVFTLILMFVRLMEMGLLGVLLGNLAGIWALNLLLAGKFWRHQRSIAKNWGHRLIAFGSPLIFSMFGWLILNSADRYFLAYFRGLEEVGLYSLGYRVGLMMQLAIVTPFQLAWGPFVFATASKSDKHAVMRFSRVFTYLMLALAGAGLSIWLFTPELVRLLGSGKFSEAEAVVPYVLVAYVFNGVFYWAASLFHLTQKTVQIGTIVASMAIACLLLNWLWVPTWGWQGAALATVITVGGTGLLTLLVGQRYYPIALERLRLGKIVGALLLLVIVWAMMPVLPDLASWLVRIMILAAYPALLLAVRFFAPDERQQLAGFKRETAHRIRHGVFKAL